MKSSPIHSINKNNVFSVMIAHNKFFDSFLFPFHAACERFTEVSLTIQSATQHIRRRRQTFEIQTALTFVNHYYPFLFV